MGATRKDDVTLAVLADAVAQVSPDPAARPALSRLLERCTWPGPTMLITPTRAVAPAHEQFTRQVMIEQTTAESVSGLLAALTNATTQTVIATSGALTNLGHAQLEWLLNALDQRDDLDLLMLSRLVNGKVQPQPLPLICQVSIRPRIEAALAQNVSCSLASLAKLPRASLILAPRQWDDLF